MGRDDSAQHFLKMVVDSSLKEAITNGYMRVALIDDPERSADQMLARDPQVQRVCRINGLSNSDVARAIIAWRDNHINIMYVFEIDLTAEVNDINDPFLVAMALRDMYGVQDVAMKEINGNPVLAGLINGERVRLFSLFLESIGHDVDDVLRLLDP